jgi:hypothetical protein
MLYEFRQYVIERGRMNDNHDRMANYNIELFRKNGVNAVGRWTTIAGPRMPLFCYLMQWQDSAERERCWGSFYADPEWATVRAKTNAGNEMVERNDLFLMTPNSAFKPNVEDFNRTIGGVHQILIQQTVPGQNPKIADFLSNIYLPALRREGCHVIGVCDLAAGPALPTIVLFLAWKSPEAWWNGWQKFTDSPEVVAAFSEQRKHLGASLFRTCDNFVLAPAPYALPVAGLKV